jgi:hypothetical protein
MNIGVWCGEDHDMKGSIEVKKQVDYHVLT